MFERFLARYPLPSGAPPSATWSHPALVRVGGYSELAASAAGLPLCGGMIRILTESEGASALDYIRLGFPRFEAQIVPFAVDWLGRLYVVISSGSSGLALIAPESGRAIAIDRSLVDFFDVDLVDDPDEFLKPAFFRDWLNHGGRAPEVRECVGFKVPLFLGGAVGSDNLELTDLDVYWTFSAELWSQTQGRQLGTRILKVDAVKHSTDDIPER